MGYTPYDSANPSGYIDASALGPYLTSAIAASTYQPILVSGTNIKTVNSTSLLGSGNIAVQATLVSGTNIKTINSTSLLGSGDVSVQATLVSGTNIKTINGSSILGSGDLTVGGLTIGTTAITSGTVGRILYEGTGNKLSESSELYFSPNDGTNPPILTVNSPTFGSKIAFNYGFLTAAGSKVSIGSSGSQNVAFFTANFERMTIFSSNGNVAIGYTTDSGYKLDVGGTTRINGNTTIGNATTGMILYATGGISLQRNGVNMSNGADADFTITPNANANSIIEMYIGFSTSRPLCINKNGNEVIIGQSTATTNASSILTCVSTTKGFLPPRMTTAQKNAISSPAVGLVVYDTTLNKLCVRTASAWETITSA